MKSRSPFINQEGELENNAPKNVQAAYEALMASISGQQLVGKFLMFKAAGQVNQAQEIIDNANAGLASVSVADVTLPCRVEAAISLNRHGRR